MGILRIVLVVALAAEAIAQPGVAFSRGIVPGQSAPSFGTYRANVPGLQQPGFHNNHMAALKNNNIGVSEMQLDGHVDDLFWASKDGPTLFLVSARSPISFPFLMQFLWIYVNACREQA